MKDFKGYRQLSWQFDFLVTHLFLVFADKDIFFQEYIEIELKTFFITFEVFFQWQK